jgi:hypothetical protein
LVFFDYYTVLLFDLLSEAWIREDYGHAYLVGAKKQVVLGQLSTFKLEIED